MQITLPDWRYRTGPKEPATFVTDTQSLQMAFRSARQAIGNRDRELHLIEDGYDSMAFLAPDHRISRDSAAAICTLFAYNFMTDEPRRVVVNGFLWNKKLAEVYEANFAKDDTLCSTHPCRSNE